MRSKIVRVAVDPLFWNKVKSSAAIRGMKAVEYTRVIGKLDNPMEEILTKRRQKNVFDLLEI